MMYNKIELPYNAKVTHYYGHREARVYDVLITIDRDSDVGKDLENELLKKSGKSKNNCVVFTVNFGYANIYFWIYDFEIIVGTKLVIASKMKKESDFEIAD